MPVSRKDGSSLKLVDLLITEKSRGHQISHRLAEVICSEVDGGTFLKIAS